MNERKIDQVVHALPCWFGSGIAERAAEVVGTDLLDRLRNGPTQPPDLLRMAEEMDAAARNEALVRVGHGRKQQARIEMARIADDLIGVAPFHHLASEHDD